MGASHAGVRAGLVVALLALGALAGGPSACAEPSGDLLTIESVLGPGPWAPRVLAQAATETRDDAVDVDTEYDPWEPLNEGVFAFNRRADQYVVKPVATGWSKVTPVGFRQSLRNVVNNLGMPRRLVNSLLQLKIEGAVREIGRFLLNSTLGIAGLFDIATPEGIPASDEDLGQTLGVYGVGPGPYLMLPLLGPSTARDTVGFVGDLFLDPLTYVLPLGGRVGMKGGTAVNDRSLNIELYEQIEADVLDLYSAVRNAYLQRRQREIRE